MGGEPHVDSLVRGADAAGLDHVSDEKPEQDRERGDHGQSAEHHQEERDDRMAVGERAEPSGEPAVTGPEDGRRLLRFAARLKATRRMCFDSGDDGHVAHLDTF